ncbi:carboxylic acid reductase [Segniliparus rugosus]|uniref:Carboxylic acid reductase n=1 Tax=Segniliparus rugosus (strain ATCC BAA-974 / DSM 45345 / CCUG 50838 / CIP 108380 / JCM 13579 / CDC 945) TaxID=679197 RepID=CAR_SEGRC|nr:carboxylic acid reductase [Segniliparus rugosus]E5XP76.1 RecName: Full=Carboxylic acid reductase; Short=CAR; AltName: Full=ATP/NADPH-dependent carboxylic acid reductase [Segniliparus rugosus ATCC BAA-974]5MSP_A Chain A, Thioester reductase domain-containing protein [Segniliparus rugosus ATCC BAA-974]5MSR_A Chain A, Thioester reductase domain-containing protein [Segniliparus rugosus]5MSR_B Chain B, Thioester reductase domain-containing protein [Segniliparus rugosus]5MSR_C Chain C, Thioester 
MTESQSYETRQARPAGQSLAERVARLVAIDPQAAAAVPDKAVAERATQQGLRLAQRIEAFLSGYGDRPALAQRAFEITKDPITGRAVATLLPKFETVSYRELLERSHAIASELANHAEAPVKAGEFIATIGFTSTDYTSLDIAGVLLGLTSVPLQTGATTDTLKAIAEETAPAVFGASVEHLDNAVTTALATPSVRRLLVFDYRQGVDEDREAVEAARSRLAEAGSAVLVDTLDEVIARGRALPRVALPPATDAGDDSLSLLIYTSGSTGTPKGAMYPERNVAQFWGGIWHNAFDDGDSAPDVPDIMVNFMPLSHVAGRIGLMGTLSSGGTTYFIAKSDLSTFFEDYSLARPTKLFFVPRICEMIYQHYQSELDRIGAADGSPQAEAIKTELREKLLGGRVLTAGSGSAPMSPELTAFIESVLQVHLVDGYGSTEAGPVWRDRKLVKPPVTEHKLIDVPELGYFSTDSPYPRGELAIKTQTILPGYYKRPETTAEVFDEDGFYLTGDVVAEVAPEEFVYVDRRKNVLKLSQGEFVALSKLEAAYGTSPLVRQISVYGSSQRSYLLAVVVPTPEALAKYGDGEAVKSALGDSLQKIAREEGLQSYEVPRDFIIETDPFTIENGILSDAGKTLRPKVKARYGERLEALYAQLAETQAGELRSIRVGAGERPVIETVQRAAAALLGASAAEVDPEAHFSDLGGDSLSALTYSNFLHEIFQVEVPVSVIVSAANNLRSVAAHIEKERSSGSDRPTFASVHGAGATTIRASDLKLEKFLDAQTLAAAPSLPRPASEVRTVLLTGSNGWLGRFLALAWLERLVPQGGKVVVIVRGKDDKAAKARLDSVFESGDPALLAHYEDLADKGLEVLAGDFSDADLGLRKADWDRLADEVDLIVHSGALVNHVLPYSQLFGPNVVGTAEVAKLALTKRLKPVTYLSTVAVAVGVEPSAFEEDGDIRDVSAVRSIDEGYANGYGNSKWAGEVLLREAYEHAGLPVRVFRSDMILAHRKYTGQLNVPDQFTRLILSLLATGIAPKSFYQLDATGGRQRAHYDGIPVDFTAEAITTLGLAGSDGYHSFDVFNPHHDGVGLDEFVDWLVEAGHPISRVDDYAEWLSRFETSLRGLPEAQRQHSVLPLLHAFAQPAPAIDGSPFQTKNFQSSVQEAKVGAEHDIPHLDKALIVKYAEDIKQLGLL